jgi:hypothetical protein
VAVPSLASPPPPPLGALLPLNVELAIVRLPVFWL